MDAAKHRDENPKLHTHPYGYSITLNRNIYPYIIYYIILLYYYIYPLARIKIEIFNKHFQDLIEFFNSLSQKKRN